MNLPDHIILCRDIRRFIIEKGEATAEEISKTFPSGSQGCLMRMSLNRSIVRGRSEDGTIVWRPSPIRPIRARDIKADLSFEQDD